MTDVEFGRLQDIPLREVWRTEAQSFTPWLAENIDRLSEKIGLQLGLTGTEVSVENFSADILARNLADDTYVLIENQLEATDHTHLGQIMTYLAGLEANTVIWIAPSFREPHLSAIRWLNEHTEGFSFFAVRLRVVRIGESPCAPIFEVVEQPDQWMREVKAQSDPSDLRTWRADYWEQLQNSVPDLVLEYHGQRRSVPLTQDGSLYASLEMHRDRAVVLVKSTTTRDPQELRSQILTAAPRIETELAPLNETNYGGALFASCRADLSRREDWDNSIRFHTDKLRQYVNAFRPNAGMT